MHRSGDRIHKDPSHHCIEVVMIDRQRSCFFLSVHWCGRANMQHDLCHLARILYTTTHTCSLHGFLHPAETTCSGHVLILLLDCSAVYGRSVTISTDGTARSQARDVFCVCLVTDLSSVHVRGGERPSVHTLPLAVCVLVAPPSVEPLTVDRWCFAWACDHAAQAMFLYRKIKKRVEMTIAASSTIAQDEFSKLGASPCLLLWCLWSSYFVSFLSFQDAKIHFTESHQCNCQKKK